MLIIFVFLEHDLSIANMVGDFLWELWPKYKDCLAETSGSLVKFLG